MIQWTRWPYTSEEVGIGIGRLSVTHIVQHKRRIIQNQSAIHLTSNRIPRPHCGALPPHRRRVLQLGGPQYAPLQFRRRNRPNRILRNRYRHPILLIKQVSE